MLLDARDPAGAGTAQAVARAARALADGELVGMPTETVYGLAARADDDAAVAKIFAAKGRPADHPLIVHVADAAGAHAFTTVVPPLATWSRSRPRPSTAWARAPTMPARSRRSSPRRDGPPTTR